MNDMSQLIEEERLFEDLCYLSYLRIGFEQVKENKGKPGIDGVTIQDFEFRMEEELSRLQQELLNWTYKPSPVRRVEIPKPGGQGVRLLGIPTVPTPGGAGSAKHCQQWQTVCGGHRPIEIL
jgi:hypothetical protein